MSSDRARVAIATLPTGVPGLDAVVGGGLPEYSFNLIVGAPGAGKTTLAHQLMFALASPARPALYITLVGEPPLKMLRYQQQFAFFDAARVGDSVRFLYLGDEVLEMDLAAVLARIVREVEAAAPGLVFVDSFHSIVRRAAALGPDGLDLAGFVQRLAVHLTTWQITTFLIGEHGDDASRGNPVFTVADGILWLSQVVHRNSVVRKLQVLKSRGRATMPGLHTFRIDDDGVQVFPRLSMATTTPRRDWPRGRVPTGVAGLDALVGGGLPAGDAVLVTGPSGAGKSVLAAQFIAAGAARGEPGVIAVFEEHPDDYVRRAAAIGIGLAALIAQGRLAVIYLRPLDLSPDEALYAIREAVTRLGARRVVIDSVAGFEMALAPSFRDDFRESLYRLVGALTGTGVTVLLTMEIQQNASDLRFSPYIVSFLADDILLLRYVEIEGQMRKSLTVIKMRNSDHSKDLWRYEITGQGLVVRDSLRDYQGVGTGAAALRDGPRPPAYPGLTGPEAVVLRALLELGAASAAALARRTGLAEPDLAAALTRLIGLHYVILTDDGPGPAYRPVARATGS